ncbi:hypothetical protein E5D57_003694 [Metarhizium anisopliae]|nr:hypothetical protein E5D57_003694 [Metarhizium anisopliae]
MHMRQQMVRNSLDRVQISPFKVSGKNHVIKQAFGKVADAQRQGLTGRRNLSIISKGEDPGMMQVFIYWQPFAQPKRVQPPALTPCHPIRASEAVDKYDVGRSFLLGCINDGQA